MRKVCTKALLALVLAVLLAACGQTVREEDVVGRTYTYEKEGFGGNFVVSLHEDGTFTYSEGVLSSHFGAGTWTLEDGVVTLREDSSSGNTRVNYFRADGENLLFKQKDSDNFTYVSVFEGEKFFGEPDKYTVENKN